MTGRLAITLYMFCKRVHSRVVSEGIRVCVPEVPENDIKDDHSSGGHLIDTSQSKESYLLQIKCLMNKHKSSCEPRFVYSYQS